MTKGTTHEFNMAAYLKLRQMQALVMNFDTADDMYKGFFAGRCQAVTQDATALAAAVVASGKATDYAMLPDIISKEPLGPAVRHGDDQWLDIVKWTHFAMINAEELGITRANVDDHMKSDNPDVKRLLGTEGKHGEALGLTNDWAYRIIKLVGNYGEVFERNVGQGSQLKISRGLNALWNKGGLQYAPPVR